MVARHHLRRARRVGVAAVVPPRPDGDSRAAAACVCAFELAMEGAQTRGHAHALAANHLLFFPHSSSSQFGSPRCTVAVSISSAAPKTEDRTARRLVGVLLPQPCAPHQQARMWMTGRTRTAPIIWRGLRPVRPNRCVFLRAWRQHRRAPRRVRTRFSARPAHGMVAVLPRCAAESHG